MSINGSVRTSPNEVVEHDLKTVNGSVKVADGSVVNGDCKTVNGSVHLGSGAQADSLKTVNGSIHLKPKSAVKEDVETVNGKISAEGDNVIEGDLQTVNGGVALKNGVQVKGDVKVVNGHLDFTGAHILGNVTLRSGKAEFKTTTIIEGNVIIEGNREKIRNEDPSEIILSGQALIKGDIILEDPDRIVNLRMMDDARVEGSMEHLKVIED